MSFDLLHAILAAEYPTDPTAALVLVVIAEAVNRKRDDGISWLSVPEIARRARVSERHARRVIGELIDAGILVAPTGRKGGKSSTTRLRIIVAALRRKADAHVPLSDDPKADTHVRVSQPKGGHRRPQTRTPMSANPDTHVPRTGSNRKEPEQQRAHARPQREPRDRNARAQPPVASLPVWLPAEAWEDFVTYRKRRGGWTAKAAELNVAKLDRLREAGDDPTAVIEQSIANGWRGLFALKRTRNADRRTDTANEIFAPFTGDQPHDHETADEAPIESTATRLAD